MRHLLRCSTLLCVLLLLVCDAYANVEKTIFLAPHPLTLTSSPPGLDALALQHLTHDSSQLRTTLERAFPNTTHSRGRSSWFILSDLQPGQRYELRICWAATEPTEFWIETYAIPDVFESPSLLSDLAAFSEAQVAAGKSSTVRTWGEQSVLFLHINSAADYFTTNSTLMQHPPAVDVDLILDPFLLGVLPRSLSPTAIYIVVLAIGSWSLSGYIWQHLRNLLASDKQHKD